MKKKIKATITFAVLAATLAIPLIFTRQAEAFEPWTSGQSQFGHNWGEAGPDDKSHQKITEEAVEHFTMERLSCLASKAAIRKIVHDNGFTDLWYANHSEAHFDCENFSGGQQWLRDRRNEIRNSLNAGQIDDARTALGRALHTIQDFYSHSNWVETVGGIYQGLGRGGILPVASGATCLGCPTVLGCEGNLILPQQWTSGYFKASILGIRFGCDKPAGKCSHGGSKDLTAPDAPKGGINKDTSNSPHGSRHLAAAASAREASELFLNTLRTDNPIIPDEQLRKLFCGPTLAICIDTTGSMGPIIEAVKNSAIAIVNRRLGTDEEPGQYVLAPFNDPDVPLPFVTTDPDAFKAAISGLSAEGGGDCPELAGGGMFGALSKAASGGNLFLYTDADAKDPARLNAATDVAHSKKIQVHFPIFGSCSFDAPTKASGRATVHAATRTNYPQRQRHTVAASGSPVVSHGVDPMYQQAAEATGGQVFLLDPSEAGQITDLLDKVSRSTAVNILSIKDSLGPTSSVYSVPIDNTLSAITFSVSGGDTSVTLTRPNGSVVHDGDPGVTIISLSGAHLFSIASPPTGAWHISVSGSGAFSITATGEGALDIKSFDFVHDGGAEAHEPGMFPIDGFPVARRTNMVSGELTDGFGSAQFEFRSPAGALLHVLTLQQGTGTANNVFVGSVIPPNTPFVVYATGHTAAGASFQRLLPGTIMPQSVTITAPGPANLVPGTVTTYTFQVHNLGPADSFSVEGADDKGFLAGITPTTLSLNADETKEVTVQLQAPANAVIGASDTLTVNVASTGASNARNFAVVVSNVVPPSHLGNISTRGFVQTGDNVMIGGFIVQGNEPKTVIVRAIGPELGAPPYNVPNALANPTLELHDGTGALIASNDNWQHTIIRGIITASQVSAIQNSGYAPGDPRESAVIAELPAGNYTAIVRGKNVIAGVALVEVYDISPDAPSILGNISTRDFVQTGDNVMIGGFIVQGATPKRVIVRAIGPELGAPPYNVPNALANPTLELHDGTGALIAANDNWRTTIISGIITADQRRDIANSGYAPGDGRESAIIADLPPGNYTAIVRGVNHTTGVALVEVYDLQ